MFEASFRCFSDIEGNITNKSIYAFSFFVGKDREPQSINAKLFLPVIPIGIVAYALTLLWDNLCRNSCISNQLRSDKIRLQAGSPLSHTRERRRAKRSGGKGSGEEVHCACLCSILSLLAE